MKILRLMELEGFDWRWGRSYCKCHFQ